MTKFKRLAALAAVSMLGIQLMGAGTAFAASSDGDCDFGSDNLEITLGTSGGGAQPDVDLWLDSDGLLNCDVSGGGGTETQAVSTIDSITVVMDDDDSDGVLTVYLDDSNGDAAEWPDFDTFDIDVTTKLYVDGSSVSDSAGNRLSVKFGASTFSFNGTSGTYAAYALDIQGGDDKDLIDASKATVKVTADGNDGDDVIKGGSKNDDLTDTSDDDIIYGNGGNDLVDAGYQAWGGEGSDDLTGVIVAPGAGDDDVAASSMVTYADLTDGIEYTDDGSDITTGGAAGDDDLSGDTFEKLDGSQGDDVLVFIGDRVRGNGGDDIIKCEGCDGGTAYAAGGAGDDLITEYDSTYSGGGVDNLFYGNAGNDVLRGRFGDDELRGGPGSDQAWGGSGAEDLCTAEVLNRCELIKH